MKNEEVGYIAVQKTGSYCFPDSCYDKQTNYNLSAENLGLSMDFIDYTGIKLKEPLLRKTSWDRVFIFD
jgi:hypothetical protein